MGDAMGSRARMLAIATVTLVVSLLILTSLYQPPSPPVEIESGEPELIDVNWRGEVTDIKALVANGTEYLFALHRTGAGDGLMMNYDTISYMRHLVTGWTRPTIIELDPEVYRTFDVLYDATNDEFLIFFRHEYRPDHYGPVGLYLARGPLDGLGPPQPIVVTLVEYPRGPYDMSAVLNDNGTIDLFYRFVTGMTENLNALFHTAFNGTTWSDPEQLGVGNSPSAIRGRDGKLQLYSNLMTYTDKVQYCVDEWSVRDGEWAHKAVTTSARDCNVEPFVIEDGSGDRFLIYEHEEYGSGAMTDLLLQIRPYGGTWGRYVRIVTDLPGNSDDPRYYWYGIENPSATIREDGLNVYYIHLGEVYTLPVWLD